MKERVLLNYSENWPILYIEEVEKIKRVINQGIVDIQHIGSTSIPGTLSKPIIDIAILIKSFKDADSFVSPLESIGYRFEPAMSSLERLFFKKGNPTQYHLSIGYADRGEYWKRQILFRDYLRNHDDARKEYEKFKINLLHDDATIDRPYKSNKNDFVERILKLAQEENELG